MYRMSISKKVKKVKATTFGYKVVEEESLEKMLDKITRYPSVPCRLRDGRRNKENLLEIFPWMRLDLDSPGELEVVLKALSDYTYIMKPSASHDEKPWKWHILLPVEDITQDYEQYKLDYIATLRKLGLEGVITDTAVKSVVQNMAGYSGDERGKVHYGRVLKMAKGEAEERVARDESEYIDRVSRSEVKAALERIDPRLPYGDWMKIGAAIADWDDGEAGFRLWDKWSRGAGDKYGAGVMRRKWKDACGMREIKLGSLLNARSWLDGQWIKQNKEEIKKLAGEVVAARHEKEDIESEIKHLEGVMKRTKAKKKRKAFEKRLKKLRGKLRKKSGLEDELRRVVQRRGDLLGKYDTPLCDKDAIMAYVENTAYDPAKGKFLWVSSSGTMRVFTERDCLVMWDEAVRKEDWVDSEVLEATLMALELEDYSEYAKAVARKMRDYIVREKQVKELSIRVDPFAESCGMRVHDRVGYVVYNSVVNEQVAIDRSVCDEEAVADFMEHFPLYKKFLKFIIASRFASDAREAYLFMALPSGFGKSFTASVLKEIGIGFEMSLDELKDIVKGSPAGVNVDGLARASALIVDEARYIPSQVKNITNEITVNQKYQMRMTVPVFAKVFMNAEGTDDLSGVVEDQFAKRFSVWEDIEGDLGARKKYQENGYIYYQSVLAWTYDFIRKEVGKYVGMSRDEAAGRGDRFLKKFHKKYRVKPEMEFDAAMLEAMRGFVDAIKEYRENGMIEQPRWYKDLASTMNDDGYFRYKNAVVTAFKEFLSVTGTDQMRWRARDIGKLIVVAKVINGVRWYMVSV